MNLDRLFSVEIALKKVLDFLQDKFDPYTIEELTEELDLDLMGHEQRYFRERFPDTQKHKLKHGRFYIYGTSAVITTVRELDESP